MKNFKSIRIELKSKKLVAGMEIGKNRFLSGDRISRLLRTGKVGDYTRKYTLAWGIVEYLKTAGFASYSELRKEVPGFIWEKMPIELKAEKVKKVAIDYKYGWFLAECQRPKSGRLSIDSLEGINAEAIISTRFGIMLDNLEKFSNLIGFIEPTEGELEFYERIAKPQTEEPNFSQLLYIMLIYGTLWQLKRGMYVLKS